MNGNKAKTNGKNGKASKVAKDRRGGNQNGNAMVSQISYPSTNGRPVRNRSTNMSGSDFLLACGSFARSNWSGQDCGIISDFSFCIHWDKASTAVKSV